MWKPGTRVDIATWTSTDPPTILEVNHGTVVRTKWDPFGVPMFDVRWDDGFVAPYYSWQLDGYRTVRKDRRRQG